MRRHACPAVSIGMLSTYASIGTLAPLLLALCRYLSAAALVSLGALLLARRIGAA